MGARKDPTGNSSTPGCCLNRLIPTAVILPDRGLLDRAAFGVCFVPKDGEKMLIHERLLNLAPRLSESESYRLREGAAWLTQCGSSFEIFAAFVYSRAAEAICPIPCVHSGNSFKL
jgi:hypothetical protein